MKVLKFGGTSVGTTENIKVVKQILEEQTGPCAVVVSAFGGVTDQIIRIATMASERNTAFREEMKMIRDRHIGTVKAFDDRGNMRGHPPGGGVHGGRVPGGTPGNLPAAGSE